MLASSKAPAARPSLPYDPDLKPYLLLDQTLVPVMEKFKSVKVVHLRSHHNNYLSVDEDEEHVSQDRNGATRWTVELVPSSSSTPSILFSSELHRHISSTSPWSIQPPPRRLLRPLHFLDRHGSLSEFWSSSEVPRIVYIDGETRIVSISRHASFSELLAHLRLLFDSPTPLTIKYQQPDEDFGERPPLMELLHHGKGRRREVGCCRRCRYACSEKRLGSSFELVVLAGGAWGGAAQPAGFVGDACADPAPLLSLNFSTSCSSCCPVTTDSQVVDADSRASRRTPSTSLH